MFCFVLFCLLDRYACLSGASSADGNYANVQLRNDYVVLPASAVVATPTYASVTGVTRPHAMPEFASARAYDEVPSARSTHTYVCARDAMWSHTLLAARQVSKVIMAILVTRQVTMCCWLAVYRAQVAMATV
jgi:hypothetical protein